MSEDFSSVSSPRKGDWVKFDEGNPPESVSEGASPTKRQVSHSTTNSSGVSSARGSVNSLAQQQRDLRSPEGAQIAVTEIQVVDEASLRLKNSDTNNKMSGSEEFQKVKANPNINHTAVSMDNVNLSDSEPALADQHRALRGRRFTNGEVITTVLPVYNKLPWVMPAKFRPELVPEDLMAPILTLTVEEYVQTMEKLTTDMRFTIFNICYKRILVLWITLAFIILLILLFSGFQGVQLFGCGVAWLILNAAAIFVCMYIKLKLNKSMESCMSFINASLLKHKIILGVDDRGKISCQKVNLCFIYFDSQDCIKKLEQILDEKQDGANADGFDREAYLKNEEGFEDVEVVVAGRSQSKNKKKDRGEKLFLHYIQRWAKDYLRRRLDWIVDDMYGRQDYATNSNPRHLRTALCPCQYIEEHLRNKRQRESLNPCTISYNPCHWCD